jgi:hypothetical protein
MERGCAARNLVVCALLTFTIFSAINHFTGFSLLACLNASRHSDHYVMKTFSLADGRYFDISFSNLFAFLIGTGFVTVMFWWRFFQHRKIDPLQLAALITIVVLSFAGLFTHETERIWLFFIPLPLMAAAKVIQEEGFNSSRLLEWAMGALFLQTWLCQVFLYTMW